MRVMLRHEFAVNSHTPTAMSAAATRLLHSLNELGLLPAGEIVFDTTDVNEDGVQSLTQRWVIAHARVVT